MMKNNRFASTVRLITSKFNDLHLKHKLLVCFGSLIVFAVVLVGAFSYYNIQKHVYREMADSFEQTLVQFKINIENKLNVYNEIASKITSDKSLALFLSNQSEAYGDISYQYLDTLSKALDIRENDANVLDAYILKDNDKLPEITGDLMELKLAAQTWWYKEYFNVTHKKSLTSKPTLLMK